MDAKFCCNDTKALILFNDDLKMFSPIWTRSHFEWQYESFEKERKYRSLNLDPIFACINFSINSVKHLIKVILMSVGF